MRESPIIPLVFAVAQAASGLPVGLLWWCTGVTVAIIVFLLLIPGIVRSRVRDEVEELLRRRRNR
ncbi:MAG: hypothetical protein A49_09730 [Methyloceanibacter sp.]|nr:MAG: hypothetical protein A49_09730 [Methyloceanibacter sp.]